MNKVLHQKRILVLHYLILKQKILVKGGLSCEYFWIKILKYISKSTNRVISPVKNKKNTSMWDWVCYPINCNSNFSESTFK